MLPENKIQLEAFETRCYRKDSMDGIKNQTGIGRSRTVKNKTKTRTLTEDYSHEKKKKMTF